MRKTVKTIAISLGIILLIIYLLIGIFPFQRHLVYYEAEKYMKENHPDFELQRINVEFSLLDNGYAVYCHSANSDNGVKRLYWYTFPFWSWGISGS